MFCKYCGAHLENDAKFCPSCGKPVEAETTEPEIKIDNDYVVAENKPINNSKPKSKLAAALLAFFLGGLGIHNFYLGNNGKGLAQLLITVLTLGIGGIFVGIWVLIEFIQILTGDISTDANGVPLE